MFSLMSSTMPYYFSSILYKRSLRISSTSLRNSSLLSSLSSVSLHSFFLWQCFLAGAGFGASGCTGGFDSSSYAGFTDISSFANGFDGSYCAGGFGASGYAGGLGGSGCAGGFVSSGLASSLGGSGLEGSGFVSDLVPSLSSFFSSLSSDFSGCFGGRVGSLSSFGFESYSGFTSGVFPTTLISIICFVSSCFGGGDGGDGGVGGYGGGAYLAAGEYQAEVGLS